MEYGVCPCGGTYANRHVEVRIPAADGGLMVLSDVPQGACPTCGSRVYKVRVLDRIEVLFHAQTSAQG